MTVLDTVFEKTDRTTPAPVALYMTSPSLILSIRFGPVIVSTKVSPGKHSSTIRRDKPGKEPRFSKV